MTQDIVDATVREIRNIAHRHDIPVSRIVVFGSQVSGEADGRNDIDVVIVSPQWKGVPFYKPPRAFNGNWPYDRLPRPDIHPLTPEEFAERGASEGDIINTARREGIEA